MEIHQGRPPSPRCEAADFAVSSPVCRCSVDVGVTWMAPAPLGWGTQIPSGGKQAALKTAVRDLSVRDINYTKKTEQRPSRRATYSGCNSFFFLSSCSTADLMLCFSFLCAWMPRLDTGSARESGQEEARERREARPTAPVACVRVARRSARRQTRGKVHREHHG